MTSPTRARPVPGATWHPAIVGGALLLAAAGGDGAVDDVRARPRPPYPGAEKKFDATAYGKENYATKVKPAIEKSPVDLVTLVPLLAAGRRGGRGRVRQAPGHLPLHVFGHPDRDRGTGGGRSDARDRARVFRPRRRVAVQVGPAINGTVLRDATGLVTFNDFVNQVDYANAATALNTEMKSELLAGLDPPSLVGQDRSPSSARPHR